MSIEYYGKTLLPFAGLATALGGTYASYTPTPDQNLLIGTLTLLVVHIYANFGLGGWDLNRTLGGDNFRLFGYEIGRVATVSTVVLGIILVMQVTYIERNRALPAAWRKKKN